MCEITRRELDGQEEEEEVDGPALLGEAALLGPALGYHHSTLRTVTRCTLWRLDAGGFAAALRMRPQVGGRGLWDESFGGTGGGGWKGGEEGGEAPWLARSRLQDSHLHPLSTHRPWSPFVLYCCTNPARPGPLRPVTCP